MVSLDDSHSRIGVGFDTARFGHYATFLKSDLTPAAKAFVVKESASGYEELASAFQALDQKHNGPHFHVRVDAAGQYAANLVAFLDALPFVKTISVGDPARNKNYCKVHFPKEKSDRAESYSCARFAIVEKPKPTPTVSAGLQLLREIVSRLEAQTKDCTRQVNRLHNLMSRVFPELEEIVSDFQSEWVLSLLKKYPTPADMRRAGVVKLGKISHLTPEKAQKLCNAADTSVACVQGVLARELVRDCVAGVMTARKGEAKLKELTGRAYLALSNENPLQSIPGFGSMTCAVLTAKIVDIGRFHSPKQLVGYFGVFPEENSSGVSQDGAAKPKKMRSMSTKGNDLVRKYLYMASWSAIRYNPAAKALYARKVSEGKPPSVALGHVMRKLLHLAFAVLKTGKAFDPNHFDWEKVKPKSPKH